MQYRQFIKGSPEISLLGFGCMRFKSKNGVLDKELALSQMKLAYDNGVNYFDTAYNYHAGKSEVLLGEFIKKYQLRDKIYIADKLPTFLINKAEQIEKYYSNQLKRLDTNYIDFYLMHMLSSLKDWEKLIDFGIIDFLKQKKEKGEIKYLGFSFHGRPEEFLKILESYPWDFTQIQFNYLDEYNQAGLAGLNRAKELGIGVAVMEPLRGGSLASKAPTKVNEILAQDSEHLSAAYWALRFVMNHDGVFTVLSGMNDDKHILENVKVASETKINSLTSEQLAVIDEVKGVYNQLMRVTCTGCNYCMPCPFNVDIPGTFNDYNSIYYFGKNAGLVRMQYIGKAAGYLGDKKSGADQCTNCNLCKKHCPQYIDIPAKLKEAHRHLNSKPLRFVADILTKITRNKSR